MSRFTRDTTVSRYRRSSTFVREDKNLNPRVTSRQTGGREGEILFLLPTRVYCLARPSIVLASVAPIYYLAFHSAISREGRESVGASGDAQADTVRERARYSSPFVSLSSFLFPCQSQPAGTRARRVSPSLSLTLSLPSSPLRRRFKRETADSRPFNRVAESQSREVSRWRPPGGFLVVYVPQDRRPGEYPVVLSGSVARRRAGLPFVG